MELFLQPPFVYSNYVWIKNHSRRSAPCRADVGETCCCCLGGETFEISQAWKVIEAWQQGKLTMDLLRACDDLKSLIETTQKLIETWDEDPDNYSKLEQHLTKLKAELEKFKDWSDHSATFQVADVDSGVVHWVNADLVMHIVARVWTSAGNTLERGQLVKKLPCDGVMFTWFRLGLDFMSQIPVFLTSRWERQNLCIKSQ